MSTFPDWRTAIAAIDKKICPSSDTQRKLAKFCGIDIKPREPFVIVAARLRLKLDKELISHDSRKPPCYTIEYLENLCESMGRPNIRNIESEGIADAWVMYLHLKRRNAALKRLKLESGDIVSGCFGEAEVASINHEGRVYFKGGKGFSAWPDTITVEERKDSGNTPLRQRVRNEASERKRVEGWSDAKAQNLKDYEVPFCSEVELKNIINTFEEVLNSANDESPLQSFIEQYPMILGSLLGRDPKYIIPRPDLGGKYIPDFLLVDIDSQGAHWTFIELESPTANIYIKGGKAFSSKARTGIQQIQEWRRWFSDNRDHARKPRLEGGLGFSDIDDRAKGLVIIGRRDSKTVKGNALRRQLKNENNISLRTYEGIIQKILSSISFKGPPAVNPYLVRSL